MWRTQPLPKDWPQIRKRVLERDGYRCRMIHANGKRCHDKATDVHHTGDNNDHRDEMLVSVCDWHHKRLTSRQANDARVRVTQKREPEKHPGLL
jgi:hypothetical protein